MHSPGVIKVSPGGEKRGEREEEERQPIGVFKLGANRLREKSIQKEAAGFGSPEV